MVPNALIFFCELGHPASRPPQCPLGTHCTDITCRKGIHPRWCDTRDDCVDSLCCLRHSLRRSIVLANSATPRMAQNQDKPEQLSAIEMNPDISVLGNNPALNKCALGELCFDYFCRAAHPSTRSSPCPKGGKCRYGPTFEKCPHKIHPLVCPHEVCSDEDCPLWHPAWCNNPSFCILTDCSRRHKAGRNPVCPLGPCCPDGPHPCSQGRHPPMCDRGSRCTRQTTQWPPIGSNRRDNRLQSSPDDATLCLRWHPQSSVCVDGTGTTFAHKCEGLRCWNQDCTLPHPKERKLCPKGNKCPNAYFGAKMCDEGSHPPKCPELTECRGIFNDKNDPKMKLCPLVHPFCNKDESCFIADCKYDHTLPRRVCSKGNQCENADVCKEGIHPDWCVNRSTCWNAECKYRHDASRILCPEGMNCRFSTCQQGIHPPLCDYGQFCRTKVVSIEVETAIAAAHEEDMKNENTYSTVLACKKWHPLDWDPRCPKGDVCWLPDCPFPHPVTRILCPDKSMCPNPDTCIKGLHPPLCEHKDDCCDPVCCRRHTARRVLCPRGNKCPERDTCTEGIHPAHCPYGFLCKLNNKKDNNNGKCQLYHPPYGVHPEEASREKADVQIRQLTPYEETQNKNVSNHSSTSTESSLMCLKTCWKTDCRRQHPPGRKLCPHGGNCYEHHFARCDLGVHPPYCAQGDACPNIKTCSLMHSMCELRDKCWRLDCRFRHSKIFVGPCRDGEKCTKKRTTCCFNHPEMCSNVNACWNIHCQYSHNTERDTELCPQGSACTAYGLQSCTYSIHPPLCIFGHHCPRRNGSCQYMHPPDMCEYGVFCPKPEGECMKRHPPPCKKCPKGNRCIQPSKCFDGVHPPTCTLDNKCRDVECWRWHFPWCPEGEKCWRVNCKYRHISERKLCPDENCCDMKCTKGIHKPSCPRGNTCWHRNCTYRHSQLRQLCPHGAECTATHSCRLIHPPMCLLPDDCTNVECKHRHHPSRSRIPRCEKNNLCTNESCRKLHVPWCRHRDLCGWVECPLRHSHKRKLRHPRPALIGRFTTTQMCPHENDCWNPRCGYRHPATRPKLCPSGGLCAEKSLCRRGAHPPLCPQGSKCPKQGLTCFKSHRPGAVLTVLPKLADKGGIGILIGK